MNRVILMMLCGAALAVAADPWKSKPAAEWTAKDAERILTRSPWAKDTTAQMNAGRMGTRSSGWGESASNRGGGGRGGGATGMPGGAGGGGGMGGGGGNGGGGGWGGRGGGRGMEEDRPPMPHFTVRWESAEPVRQALARIESPAASTIADWSKEFIVVSLGGLRAVGAEGMTQRLKQVTTLQQKGREKLAAARVEMMRSGDALVALFLFPRTEAITPEDKDVVFESSLGPLAIKETFHIHDMQYGGKPAI